LRVEYGDCATIVRGPTCLLRDDRHLRLWIEAGARDAIEISDDVHRYSADKRIEVQGGYRFELEIPPGATVLRVRTGRGSTSTEWQLRLGTEAVPTFLVDARALRSAGKREEALALLEHAVNIDTDPRRGSVLGLMGRIFRDLDRREEARDALQRAIEANLAEGRRMEALEDATVLSFVLMHKWRDFEQARVVLEGFDAGWDGAAEPAYYLGYFRGLIGFNTDDARTSLPNLAAAADQAERMGWERRLLDADQNAALQLQVLGRREEASALLAKWKGERLPDASSCEHANFLTNLGWSALLVLEAGEHANDPTPVLKSAMNIYAKDCPPNDRVNGLLNLALAHLHAGRLDEAASAIALARNQTEQPELRMVLWSLDIEGRIALARGEPARASSLYDELRQLGMATLSPDAVWRAEIGEAESYEASGDSNAALTSYAAAAAQLDSDIFRVPLDEGRETLVASRERVTRRYLALLLDAGRTQEAFDLARHSRSQMLNSLRPARADAALSAQAREEWREATLAYRDLQAELTNAVQMSWSLTEDELQALSTRRVAMERELRKQLDRAVHALESERSPVTLRDPQPGELLLVFHALPDGWVTFALNGVDLVAERPACATDADGETLASCLISPFAETIRAASLLRVLPIGTLNHVDFQALPFDGDVLLSKAPIVYGLDLSSGPVESHGGNRALLVADPTGNLSGAREEARIVTEKLRTGWTFDVLEGQAADGTSVLNRIEQADLFHFAGHARFAGPTGWSSALELASQTTVGVDDILALTRVPDFVVLSGCETGTTAGLIEQPSIGLAQAFLVSGSEEVIASTRPVGDSTTQRIMDSFYREWTSGVPASRALQVAQLEARRSERRSDWSAFRLIER
jgi:tetratricopeptide (TPR) repeat protein